MKKAIVASALVVFGHGCLKTGGDGGGLSQSDAASYALSAGVSFEGGTVIQAPISETTVPDAVITPIGGSMILSPGVEQIVALDVRAPADDPVASTLVQFGSVRRHISVSARRPAETSAGYESGGGQAEATGRPAIGLAGGERPEGSGSNSEPSFSGDPSLTGDGEPSFTGDGSGDPSPTLGGGEPPTGAEQDPFLDGPPTGEEPYPGETTEGPAFNEPPPMTSTVLEGSYALSPTVCNSLQGGTIPVTVTFAVKLVSGRVGSFTMVDVDLNCTGDAVEGGDRGAISAGACAEQPAVACTEPSAPYCCVIPSEDGTSCDVGPHCDSSPCAEYGEADCVGGGGSAAVGDQTDSAAPPPSAADTGGAEPFPGGSGGSGGL